MTKKIRKNPVVSGLLAAGLVIALTAIGFAIYTRYRASEQNRYANEFNLEAQDIQQRLRYFYTQPAHDVRAEEETIRKRLQKLETDLTQVRSVAQAPGSYVLGLGYFGLGDYQKSKKYLEQAWNRGNYQAPQVAYAYGLSQGMYAKQLEEADQLGSPTQHEARRKQIEGELLHPALEYLEKGRTATQTPLYAEAVIALLEKRYQGIAKAEKALAQMPWLYEADKLIGDAYNALARDLERSGKQTRQ